MEVGVADAAAGDPHAHLTLAGLGCRPFLDHERLLAAVEHGCFHDGLLV
jgi:hypothetical protein